MKADVRAAGILFVALLTGACGSQGGSEAETADAPMAQPAAESTAPASSTVEARTWGFDDLPAGSAPAGWRLEQSNPRGEGAQWVVSADATAPSAGQVLALTDPRGARTSTYNLAWTNEPSFGDGRIEVKVKAGGGREDQGGGPMWRVRDANNYYIARWNPLEDNFRLYSVREGRREQLESADADLPDGQWHTLAIEHRGDRIVGFLNGERMFETTDDTFSEPGGVGLWTKADAATLFDDLSVTP